jgi:hypothetical protein
VFLLHIRADAPADPASFHRVVSVPPGVAADTLEADRYRLVMSARLR